MDKTSLYLLSRATKHALGCPTGDTSSDSDDVMTEYTVSSTVHSSSSSSTAISSNDESPESSSDEDYRPPASYLRHAAVPQVRSMAARDGVTEVEKLWEFLSHQHEARAADFAFIALRPPDDRPKASQWRRQRLGFLKPFAIRTLLLASPDRAVRPRTRTRAMPKYTTIAAAVRNPAALFESYISYIASSCEADLPSIPIVLAADAVGNAMTGMPAGGKAFSLWAKPLHLLADNQSPNLAVPLLILAGSDSSARVQAAVDTWPGRVLTSIRSDAVTFTESRRTISFLLMGDYPAVYAFAGLPPPNRPLPSTPGRVPYWNSPICWSCGNSPAQIYSRTRWKERHLPLAPNFRACLLPHGLLYYAPVHAICQVTLAVLADIANAYAYTMSSGFMHPVCSFAYHIFPIDQFDPFRISAAARAPERRSNKPLIHVDPALTFAFLVDTTTQHAFLRLLGTDPPLRWLTVTNERDPCHCAQGLWYALLRWVDGIFAGDANLVRLSSPLVMEVWLGMLAATRPPPAGLVAGTSPDFDCRLTGFGPASHLALCRMADLIDRVNGLCSPRSRLPFLHRAAEIWLEHGQKAVAETYAVFQIGRSPKRLRPRELLQRLLERAFVHVRARSTASLVVSASESVPEPVDEPAPKQRRVGVNRAYRDVPLSARISLTVWAVFQRDPACHRVDVCLKLAVPGPQAPARAPAATGPSPPPV